MPYPQRRGASRASWMIAAALLAAGTPAEAAGTGQLVVSAVVVSKGVCRFRSAATTLAFGTIDPASTAAASASTPIVIRCTGAGSFTTVTYALAAGNGLHSLGAGLRRVRHATATTEFMPYNLNLSPASAAIPKNADFTITVSGSIAASDFQNASAGSYSDTVVLSLEP